MASQHDSAPTPPHVWWVRGLYMLLMALAFQLAASVLMVVAVVQWVLFAATDSAQPRLARLGQSLALYLAQVAAFESFASEALPFPFSDWPSAPHSPEVKPPSPPAPP